jgi:dihydropteroate synthase
MMNVKPYSLNIRGQLFSLEQPQVMGILNVTPDSFYAPSRKQDVVSIRERVEQIAIEGGTMIDVGAYSSRPGAVEVSREEEMERLRGGLSMINQCGSGLVVSVDTFRADVAKMCVEEFGVAIVNDISGGQLDPDMFATVAHLQVPYILMHMKGTPQNMQQAPHYDNLMVEMFLYFSTKVKQLHDLGVNDIILDPGFGFAKTLKHNYELLAHLEEFREFNLPLLVGFSRKTMIYKLLGGQAADALNGTTAVNAISLMKGADILRVHDVKACVETVKIFNEMTQQA